MKIDYSGIIRKSFRFSYGFKRWVPFYIMDAAFLAVLLYLFLGSFTDLLNVITNPEDMVSAANLMNAVLILILAFMVWGVVRLWASGALIHQSVKEKEFDKSWSVSKKRLVPMVFAAVLTGIVSFAGSIIPYVGWVISIVFSWVFLFILQAIVIDNKGAVEGIKRSWGIFRKSPFDVFVIWLLTAAITISIVIIFSIPLLATIMGSIVASGAIDVASNPEAAALLMMVIQKNLFVTVALGLVALIGFEVAYVFATKAQTEFYQQAKKK